MSSAHHVHLFNCALHDTLISHSFLVCHLDAKGCFLCLNLHMFFRKICLKSDLETKLMQTISISEFSKASQLAKQQSCAWKLIWKEITFRAVNKYVFV